MTNRALLGAVALLALLLLAGFWLLGENTPSYDVLDSDDEDLAGTSLEALRTATLLVSTQSEEEEDLRAIARDLKEDHEGYDALTVLFVERGAGGPPGKGVAVVVLTPKGERVLQNIRTAPVTDGEDGDGVHLFPPSTE